MNIKIDTKEVFNVITPIDSNLTANMAANIMDLSRYITMDIPHIVLNMIHVNAIDTQIAFTLAEVQQKFYENDKSFVICCLTKDLENVFEKQGLIDTLNYTPTESEAWDIVQMEEIERELLNDF